jgi:hypothetical protein
MPNFVGRLLTMSGIVLGDPVRFSLSSEDVRRAPGWTFTGEVDRRDARPGPDPDLVGTHVTALIPGIGDVAAVVRDLDQSCLDRVRLVFRSDGPILPDCDHLAKFLDLVEERGITELDADGVGLGTFGEVARLRELVRKEHEWQEAMTDVDERTQRQFERRMPRASPGPGSRPDWTTYPGGD